MLGQTLYEMKKIIYEKITAGIFGRIKQWRRRERGSTQTKFILEASCVSALKRVRCLDREEVAGIEESKAIPWRDLSLEQKYVCLGAELNKKPGKDVAKMRRNISLAQTL